MRRALRQPWWTLPVIGLVASLPLVVRRVGDPDFFWHELTGQWMVQHRAVATHELYTYTVPGTPWTDHEYLTQLLFYGLQRVGGLLAVSIVFGAITWAGFWLIYYPTSSQTRNEEEGIVALLSRHWAIDQDRKVGPLRALLCRPR